MKILITGILLVCLNTISGSTFDAITKYLSTNNYKWYHYYSIGGTAAIFVLFIFLNFIGGIKKHIFLKCYREYITHNNKHFLKTTSRLELALFSALSILV